MLPFAACPVTEHPMQPLPAASALTAALPVALDTTPAAEQRPDIDALSLLCKAGGDALRLRILRILRADSLGVLEMCRILDTRQPALSHHLKVLSNAGLVASRREGNAIFYRRVFLNSEDPLQPLKRALYDSIDRLPGDPETEERLLEVREERARQSLDFFTRSAERFRANQDLVADAGQYAASLQELLDGMALPPKSTVIEVGPGEGRLLPLLSRSFKQVIALDNSDTMLKLARATARQEKLSNVRFVFGDTAVAVQQGLRADLVIFSMVLHHVAAPAESFAEAAQLLRPGGILLVIDLCRHHQDWVRDSCGDLWLGFEEEDLCNWAGQAGFSSGQHLLQGLRNGFQIQLRVFQLVSEH
jgi:ubiquinone/menaquinone biosynthesis C-methylase UbiE/DNA-binding transcriptional ArsR family regulator